MHKNIVLKQSAFELNTWLRNGEQALLNFLIPIAVLIGMTKIDTEINSQAFRFSSLMAISASCFAGLAITTAFDRRYGSIKFLGMTPLGKSGFITARIMTALMIATIQFSLLAVTAVVIGIEVSLNLSFFISLTLSVTTWTTWALVLAATLRAEAVLAIANTLFIVFASSAFALKDSTSLWLTIINPLAAAMNSTAEPFNSLFSLGLWTVIGFITAKRNFTWV